MFSIVAVNIYEGAGSIIVSIDVLVVSLSLILVIVLAVGASAVVISFVVISVNIVKIGTIVLDDGASAGIVAVVVNNEGTRAINSTHHEFIWDIGRMNTLVYWLIDGD